MAHFLPRNFPRYPSQLSGGERQRVGIMRALMLDPEVLLMDEPLGALDPVTRDSVQQELRDLFRSVDKSVVMVTHDMAEAAFFGDRIVLMRAGSIVQYGSLDDLLERPVDDFVRSFTQTKRNALRS